MTKCFFVQAEFIYIIPTKELYPFSGQKKIAIFFQVGYPEMIGILHLVETATTTSVGTQRTHKPSI